MSVVHCRSELTESGAACGSSNASDFWGERKYREALVCHMPFRSHDGVPRLAVRGIEVNEVPGYLCKACARSLNKRDREFQRKVRRWFGSAAQAQSLKNTLRFRADEILHPWAHASRKLTVERAIAREEGRS